MLSKKPLLRLIVGVILTLGLTCPAMAQIAQIAAQKKQLHIQLLAAIKSKNKPEADDLRKQILVLAKQQMAQRRQLQDQLQKAIKAKDRPKADQLRRQIRDSFKN